jgi:hypothetical protein
MYMCAVLASVFLGIVFKKGVASKLKGTFFDVSVG